MQMTILGIPLGTLFLMWAMPNQGNSNHKSHTEYVNKIWLDWHDKIDRMAEKRFHWDKTLAEEAVTYILNERLPKEYEKLLNQSSSFILLVFSHWLADYARKIFGTSTSGVQCIGQRPLYREAIQLIVKLHLPKAEFYMARVVETLANEHPDVNREEITKTVLAIKAYYLLAVYQWSRRETVELLKGESTISSTTVESIVTEVLQKCRIATPPKNVPLDNQGEDDVEKLGLPYPELPLEEQFAEQRREQLELVISTLLGGAGMKVEDPEVQKMLNCLQMAKVTELEKLVLRMRYYHDMTAKEIANSEFGRQHEMTGRKVFTLSDSALKKLHKVLQDYLSR